MAVSKKKKKKVKSAKIEMTLWDVILSYPDLHDPKPYKNKIYYKTDILLDPDHAQLGELRKAIREIREGKFGEDKSEWPDGAKKVFIKKGDEREDQPSYQGKLYVSASTQQAVPVVDIKGKPFPAQSVRGGMFANVAICITTWENEGDEGMSIYLQGVQIDTTKKGLNFGGGKSVDEMFKRTKGSSMEESEEEESEEDDIPRGQKGKKSKKNQEEE